VGANIRLYKLKTIQVVVNATLPLKAKYEYHRHLLSLTHIATVENDDSEEYYCLICKKTKKCKSLVLLLHTM
jgi:hypothetical protein